MLFFGIFVFFGCIKIIVQHKKPLYLHFKLEIEMKKQLIFGLSFCFLSMSFLSCDENDQPNSELFGPDGNPKTEQSVSSDQQRIEQQQVDDRLAGIPKFQEEEVMRYASEYRNLRRLYRQAKVSGNETDIAPIEQKMKFIDEKIEEVRKKMSAEEVKLLNEFIEFVDNRYREQ